MKSSEFSFFGTLTAAVSIANPTGCLVALGSSGFEVESLGFLVLSSELDVNLRLVLEGSDDNNNIVSLVFLKRSKSQLEHGLRVPNC